LFEARHWLREALRQPLTVQRLDTMNITLHKKARTIPAGRQEMGELRLGNRALAKKHGVGRATARKRKNRYNAADASHRSHILHTTRTHAQEQAVVYLRQSLLLSLDDLLAVVNRQSVLRRPGPPHTQPWRRLAQGAELGHRTRAAPLPVRHHRPDHPQKALGHAVPFVATKRIIIRRVLTDR